MNSRQIQGDWLEPLLRIGFQMCRSGMPALSRALCGVVGGGCKKCGSRVGCTCGSRVGCASGCVHIAPKAARCCEIPEPCWMPQPLGTVLSSTCAGGAVVVRFEVTNKDLKARTVQTGVNGPAATRVDFDPASLTLGPMERGVVTAKLSLPADAAEGAEYEAILWIRGCRDYYLRWTVTVGVTDGGCCSAIEVVDGPDYVHHWYDHFYIERPCHNDKA